ncbi:MAG TPA: hypothetical protein VK284_14745, partial [Streptosporangiaceae bacterium]|nr:hypothetical protein [Streptosporangiaceae bacterium]
KRGLMQTNVDPDNPMAQSQKYMMYIVPFFSLTGLYWQFGLVLYWVTTNLWTLGQQWFMFRNWTVEPAQAAGATAAATAASGSGTKTASGTAKTASGTARAASGTAKTASASPRPAAGNGRPASGAPRAKTGSGAGGTTTAADRVRTGSASRDAAANASGPPNGQNGAAKRSLLRLGRPKQEAAPEPEVPATKVVRQQPVRQAKSKRSGKR